MNNLVFKNEQTQVHNCWSRREHALPMAKPSSVNEAPILLFLFIFSLAVIMCSQKLTVRGGTIMWKFHKWLFFSALRAGANTSTSSCNNHAFHLIYLLHLSLYDHVFAEAGCWRGTIMWKFYKLQQPVFNCIWKSKQNNHIIGSVVVWVLWRLFGNILIDTSFI